MSETVNFAPQKSTSVELVRTKYRNVKMLHWCEKCGSHAYVTPQEGYELGYDGPWMYGIGVISPRTCSKCSIVDTVWWKIVVEGKSFNELSESDHQTLGRILKESETLPTE